MTKRLRVIIEINVESKVAAKALFDDLDVGELWDIVDQSIDGQWVDEEMDGWNS